MGSEKRNGLKKNCHHIIQLIKWDFSTLFLFEVIYKLIWLILSPYLNYGLIWAIRYSHLNALTQQNIFALFKNPLSICMLLGLGIIIIVYIYIEISAITFYLDSAFWKRKIGVCSLFQKAFQKAFHLLRQGGIGLPLFLLAIIPLVGVTLSTAPFSSFQLPEFIVDFLKENKVLWRVYIGVILILGIVMFQWIFCIQEMILHNSHFYKACKVSFQIQKKKRGKTLRYLIIWSFILHLLLMIGAGIGIGLLLLIVKLCLPVSSAPSAFWFYFSLFRIAGFALAGMIIAAGNLGLTTILYYQYQEEGIEKEEKREENQQRKGRWIKTGIKITTAILLLLFYTDYAKGQEEFFKNGKTIQIVAHRAGAILEPENTISALKEAIKADSDYAEIDIQQLQDGTLIVLHDNNFKRVTGINKNVWDVTLEEVKGYRVKHPYLSFKEERIPTLEEILESAGTKIGLMIELKKSGKENGIEERTIRLIEEKGKKDLCMIASMDYSILERVKKLAQDIPTVYITMLAYGELEKFHAADMFSVEASFINQNLVESVHSINKKIYAWTVNKEKTIKKAVQMGVDGVITDNPYLAYDTIHRGEQGQFFREQINKFLGEE